MSEQLTPHGIKMFDILRGKNPTSNLKPYEPVTTGGLPLEPPKWFRDACSIANYTNCMGEEWIKKCFREYQEQKVWGCCMTDEEFEKVWVTQRERALKSARARLQEELDKIKNA